MVCGAVAIAEVMMNLEECGKKDVMALFNTMTAIKDTSVSAGHLPSCHRHY